MFRRLILLCVLLVVAVGVWLITKKPPEAGKSPVVRTEPSAMVEETVEEKPVTLETEESLIFEDEPVTELEMQVQTQEEKVAKLEEALVLLVRGNPNADRNALMPPPVEIPADAKQGPDSPEYQTAKKAYLVEQENLKALQLKLEDEKKANRSVN